MKRNALLLCSLLPALLVAGCQDKESLAHLPETSAADTVRKVQTILVQRDEVTDDIQATGNTLPKAMTKIMPLVPGIITRLPVQEGNVVQKGQVLAVIDQRNYKLHLRQAEAAIEQAKVAGDAASRERDRFRKLAERDAAASAQVDQIEDKYRGTQVAMKQAQVAYDMARKAMQDTVLRAPYAGVVVKRLASLGDYATSMPPTVIVVLMDVSTLQLQMELPEAALGRVEPGSPVEATFSSQKKTVQTQIARVVRSVDPLTRSFQAIAELPNEDLSLQPGVFAEVKIRASKPRARTLLPSRAVLDEGGGIFSVYVAENGRARRVEVKVSSTSQEQVEVLTGLAGGEQVILEASGLLDGDRIQQSQPAAPNAEAAQAAAAEATR